MHAGRVPSRHPARGHDSPELDKRALRHHTLHLLGNAICAAAYSSWTASEAIERSTPIPKVALKVSKTSSATKDGPNNASEPAPKPAALTRIGIVPSVSKDVEFASLAARPAPKR